jgi:hypothetical protein
MDSLVVGAEEGVGQTRLEGAGVAAATTRRDRAGTEAFRIEIGVGLRFEVGVATFWVFREFSVESCRRFLAGLVRMVIRGGEGAWRVDGKGVF